MGKVESEPGLGDSWWGIAARVSSETVEDVCRGARNSNGKRFGVKLSPTPLGVIETGEVGGDLRLLLRTVVSFLDLHMKVREKEGTVSIKPGVKGGTISPGLFREEATVSGFEYGLWRCPERQ